jgi:hypothetical protein
VPNDVNLGILVCDCFVIFTVIVVFCIVSGIRAKFWYSD